MTEPEIRVRSPWPGRLWRLTKLSMVCLVAWGVWRARGCWLPPTCALTRAFTDRLSAELAPVRRDLAARLAGPAPDASAGYVAASRLGAPDPRLTALPRQGTAPPRRAYGAPDTQRPVGQPLLLDDHTPVSEWARAKPIVIAAVCLAAFFGLWAWHRGSGRLKTFT